ncbi:MAG TPA: hypothetical protein VJ783_07480 [Pirellulales bacterium]|nr:hypothetical protein [Pirellulales bacterium]
MKRIESQRRKVTGPTRRAVRCGGAAAFLLVTAVGCSPSPPAMEDLGQLVYDPSQVPGSDRPYKLPYGLDEAKSAEEAEGEPPAEGSPVESQAKSAE